MTKKIDVYKPSDEELANSQVDYFIKSGIFKKPGDVDKNTMDIATDRFNSLTQREQDALMTKVSNEWWNEIGKDWMNGIYSDKMIARKEEGDILDWWKSELGKNEQLFAQVSGIKKYMKDIKDNVGRINEDSVELEDWIKENNMNLDSTELKHIKQQLNQRRKDGGCGMWRNVAIPYLYKNDKSKLYNYEIEWYENELSKRK